MLSSHVIVNNPTVVGILCSRLLTLSHSAVLLWSLCVILPELCDASGSIVEHVQQPEWEPAT